jgi:hypothetical protein
MSGPAGRWSHCAASSRTKCSRRSTPDRRWPRPATSPAGVAVLTIWARTQTGRPLIVAVRQTGDWGWLIIGAREMHPTEAVEFARWEEASHD